MSYSNRKYQLENTLKSIKKSKHENYEIIIVDDASKDEHRIEDLREKYNFNLIRIDEKDKYWVNPCIPYNMAIEQAKGDIIIIQNPECYHYDDVLSFAQTNVNDSNYFSFAVYSLDQFNTMNCFDAISVSEYDSLYSTFNHQMYMGEGSASWYNHRTICPKGYHFCSAISAKNIKELGGFDPVYVNGIGYDDDDLIFRIQEKKLEIYIPDRPLVLHQWHYTEHFRDRSDVQKLCQINNEIYRAKFHSIFNKIRI